MRIGLLTTVAALSVASSALAQGGADRPIDGSAPGTVLLVLRERPAGKPALIVREPPNSNGHPRQRNIIYFSPTGTPAELAMAVAAFNRIRHRDGDVITRPLSDDNIGTPRLGMVRQPASGDPVRDSLNNAAADQYLGTMKSMLDFVHAVPETVVPGIGKVRWTQLDRLPFYKGPQ